jgi:transcriptional regulator with XRE-family HTH domain
MRLELKERWAAEHPHERRNPYTQENMGQRIGVTRDAYRKWETVTEPGLKRLRQIAVALERSEDYFDPTGSLSAATLNLEAETERVRVLADDLEGILPVLREAAQSLGRDEPPSRAPGEQR